MPGDRSETDLEAVDEHVADGLVPVSRAVLGSDLDRDLLYTSQLLDIGGLPDQLVELGVVCPGLLGRGHDREAARRFLIHALDRGLGGLGVIKDRSCNCLCAHAFELLAGLSGVPSPRVLVAPPQQLELLHGRVILALQGLRSSLGVLRQLLHHTGPTPRD